MSMPVVVQSVGDTTFRGSPIAFAFTSNITAGNALVAFAWINSPDDSALVQMKHTRVVTPPFETGA